MINENNLIYISLILVNTHKIRLEGLIRESREVNSTRKYYKCYVRILTSCVYGVGNFDSG